MGKPFLLRRAAAVTAPLRVDGEEGKEAGIQIQYQFQKKDEYFTPACAVYPIMERLETGTVVWCPFDTAESEFVKVLSAHGFRVVYSHISTGQDFFSMAVPDCDYIVSNPPYSRKEQVIRRLYEIGRPFAMLLNFQGIFDSKGRFRLFHDNRIEMLWLSPRVNYIGEGKGNIKRVPFQSGYLCSGICKNQLEFAYLSDLGKEG
ncbi:MAG: sugar-phospahte nucleotidyltransferase [Lachnospiraceae bacterium]|nr:sugar-phospahte nucleotidyltransferase [Lachnospiraceae bacterium]